MSNFHYNDQSGCPSCATRNDYSSLANTTNYSCDQKCSCRFSNERSTRDKLNYDWYVLGKPMNLPPFGGQPSIIEYDGDTVDTGPMLGGNSSSTATARSAEGASEHRQPSSLIFTVLKNKQQQKYRDLVLDRASRYNSADYLLPNVTQGGTAFNGNGNYYQEEFCGMNVPAQGNLRAYNSVPGVSDASPLYDIYKS